MREIDCAGECVECPVFRDVAESAFKAGDRAEEAWEATADTREKAMASMGVSSTKEFLNQPNTTERGQLDESKALEDYLKSRHLAVRSKMKSNQANKVLENCPTGQGVVIETKNVTATICLRNPAVPKHKRIQLSFHWLNGLSRF